VSNDNHTHAPSSGASKTRGATEVAVDEDVSSKTEFERGPHRGRMLRDGELALEITIFEEGVPPEFHVYPSLSGNPLDPSALKLDIELGRLGNPG
jgi:membrane fusion protein, heavy metal efflux system